MNLIQFEGCTVATIAPEDLEKMENQLATLRAEVERLTQVCKEEGLHRKYPCRICGYNGPGFYQPETHKCMAQSAPLQGGGE